MIFESPASASVIASNNAIDSLNIDIGICIDVMVTLSPPIRSADIDINKLIFDRVLCSKLAHHVDYII